MVRRTVALTMLVIACVALGATAKSLFQDPGVPPDDRLARGSTARVLHELKREGNCPLDVSEFDAFAEAHGKEVRLKYFEFIAEKDRGQKALAEMIETNYTKEGMEVLVPRQPTDAEDIGFVFPTFEGKVCPLPIDRGDWPDYFPRHRFGPGPRNAIKSYVYERFFQDRI